MEGESRVKGRERKTNEKLGKRGKKDTDRKRREMK